MEDEFFKKFRRYLIAEDGCVWLDPVSGIKWHLKVIKKEFIAPEKTSEAETPSVKKTSGLSTWLKK